MSGDQAPEAGDTGAVFVDGVLVAAVHVQHPETREWVVCEPCTTPSAELAALITNPAAWERGVVPRLLRRDADGNLTASPPPDANNPDGDGDGDGDGATDTGDTDADGDNGDGASAATAPPKRARKQ